MSIAMVEDLQKRRSERAAAMQAIHKKAESEDRDLGSDEAQEWDKLQTEIEQFDARIKRAMTLGGVETAAKETVGRRSSPDETVAGNPIPAVKPNVEISEEGLRREIMAATRTMRPIPGGRVRAFANEQQAFDAGMWIKALNGMFRPDLRNPKAEAYCETHGIGLRAGMTVGVDAEGGFFVPEIVETAIINLRELYGVFRSLVPPMTMGAETVKVPRQTGTITLYAVGEEDAITESKGAFGMVELVAKKWAALIAMSSELVQDSLVSFAEWFVREVAYGMALKEDQIGFTGDGTSTYHKQTGIANFINDGNHAGSIVTTATGSLAFADILMSEFESVVGKLPNYILDTDRTVWIISKPGWAASMQRLMDAAGGVSMGEIAAGAPRSFMGYPVIFSQVLNKVLTDTASTIKCLFGVPMFGSKFGERRGLTIAQSEHYKFNTDQICYRMTTRHAIVTHDAGNATDAGPVIALKTPAS